MTNTTVQKNDHSMKHIMFIVLAAVTVLCLVLASSYFQP